MGWFANILLILGLWLVGDKKRIAFMFTFVGESIWTIYSIIIGMYDLAFICFVFAFLAIRNWIKWGKTV